MTFTVLSVLAHPDDEAIWCGGTLAKYADAGARTAVVDCTWAEGTVRAGELERSLGILGAQPPRLLGYADARDPDSAPGAPRFVDVPLEESVGRVVGHIRELRPDAVITFDANGSSGHPDHVHAHRVTLAAVEAAAHGQMFRDAGAPWRTQALYLATLPLSVVRAQWEAVLGSPPEPGQSLPGTPDEHVTTRIDIAKWGERKYRAMLAHESEAARGASLSLLLNLPEEARALLLSNEWYVRVGHRGPAEDALTG
ncbi:PIG-L deacetylase family protein [Nonomuraea longicatena]|uniref:PIG-L family deacetylase n=1 Tax=Nonomuraea longicatena TaxID=83682 RepID=A0ABN1PL34_9ACTN